MAKQRLSLTKLHAKGARNLPHRNHLILENEELRAKLAEAEQTLQAIQSGDVDAVVVSGPQGERVFTLRGAEYAYRALVEAMNEGAATVAADGAILYCNNQVSLLLQLPLEKLIGKPLEPLVAAADKDLLAGLFARALAGEACRAEIQFQAQDATFIPTYVALSPLEINQAAAVCMVITDLRSNKKRDELIAAGNLARSILEHTAEAIAVCDAEGRIILANEALRTLCGRNPQYERFDEVLPLEVVAPSAHENELTGFSVSMALSGKRVRAREVIYRRPHERANWLLLTAGPFRNGDQVIGCVLSLVDISNRKAAEKALLRSEKLAATGQLAATIAHEINNPLAAIYNLLFLIQQEPCREQAQKFAGDAILELSRVSHITKQTLAFYRDSAGPEKINIAEVLDDILSLFKKEFESRKATFEKDYADAREVDGYPGEMRQVFSNLIRNSLEALPAGGHIRLHIRRSRHAGKDGVAIFIFDNGNGIRPEIRRRIFEPFFTTKAQKGTGLGLWVAKDLIEKHGGSIRVRSSVSPPHLGSCFHVFLPAAARSTVKREPARGRAPRGERLKRESEGAPS